MNGKGILNTKLKIIIIIAYTFILFLLVFLIFGNKKVNQFSEYKEQYYDNHLALSVRVTEKRNSLYETYDKSNTESSEKKLGINEKSKFDIRIYFTKLKVEVIKNIKVNVIARTKDKTYKYSEYGSTPSISSGVFTQTVTLSDFSTKEVVTKSIGNSSKKYIYDETPEKIYVQISYKVDNKSEENILKCVFSTIGTSEKSLNKYKTRDILTSSDTQIDEDTIGKDFINPAEDLIAIKLQKKEDNRESSINEIYKDKYQVEIRDYIDNIKKYQLSDEKIKSENLIQLEQPTLKVVFPEIINIKVEIWGKIESQDKKFSNYVNLYSLYGFISRYREIDAPELEIDESFNLSEIYITIEGKLYHGTIDKYSSKYKVSYKELPEIDSKTDSNK